MKHIIPFFIIFILLSSFGFAQLLEWKQMPSATFDKMEFSASGVFYAISRFNKKVYMSTDGGNSWSPIHSPIAAPSEFNVNNDTVLVGCTDGKLYVSIDAGNSFSLLKIFPSEINSIEFKEINSSSFLIVGTSSSGLFLSIDFGMHWVQKEFDGKPIATVRMIGNKIFAGTVSGGYYITEDHGNSWVHKFISSVDESVWYLEPAESDSVIYAASEKLYKSTNYGNTWIQLLDSIYTCIKYSKKESQIFVGSKISCDSGETWKSVFPGRVRWIAIQDSTTYILNDGRILYKEYVPYQGNSFFPMVIGNTWQYLGYSYSNDGISSSRSYNLMAINVLYDTLISDKTYYRINGSGFNDFYRYEDNKMFKYGATGDVLCMDFNLKPGQTFQSGNITITVGDGYKNLFGHERYYKATEYSPVVWGREWKHYNDSIGYSYTYYFENGPMGSRLENTANIIQAKIKIGDSLYFYKADFVPTILADSAFVQSNSMFTLFIKAVHPYDKTGSTPEKSLFFIDSVDVEYFFSNETDTTTILRTQMLQSPNSNLFNVNIPLPDSFYYNNYSLNYRFYIKDKGIIPTYCIYPEDGYITFYLGPTDVKNSKTTAVSFKLYQNYPNPFNSSTTISYQIPTNNFVTIKVYDVLGNEIATLVNEEKAEGLYQVNFTAQLTTNNKPLASGMYFYTLAAGKFTDTKKFILLK